MKNKITCLFLALGLATLATSVQAQPTAHYVPGVEGIDAATLPPPGWYLRDYNVAYAAGQMNSANGDTSIRTGFHAFTYANVPRLIWISDTKLLGGSVGVDGFLPLIYQNVQVGVLSTYSRPPGPVVPLYKTVFHTGTFGIGDAFAESTLSWHLKHFDFAAGLGVWMPTGDFAAPPTTDAGLGYWTAMWTAGGTWHIDADKTWDVSALCRYELNTEQRRTRVTRGDAFTLEWGASKKLQKVIDVGAVGYYQQKVSDDSGPLAFCAPQNRAAGVGPEINVAFPKQMFFVSCRYLYEFIAENRAQGQALVLTLTKRF
jgi:hypothetical protein